MSGIRVVSLEEGAAMASNPPENLVVLDVRADHEFGEGHLEGAIMIDVQLEDFPEKVGQLDKSVPYLVYCKAGSRSARAVELMSQIGFTDVAALEGGFMAWEEAGNPIAT